MLERGLITVVRIEQRGRHRVPMYAATAQSFIVPMELIPQVSNESWLQRNATEFEQLAQRSLIQVGRKYTGRWQLSCATINATVRVRVLLSVDEGFELEAFNRFANVRLGGLCTATFRLGMLLLE